MKKLLFTAIAMLAVSHLCSAQNCSQFINAVNGKKIIYSNQDAKGKEVGKLNYTCTKKDASTVAIHTEVIDKSGQSQGTSESEITCNGESINIDMKSFIPPTSTKQFSKMQMQGDAKYLTYPINPKVGQTLQDGTMDMVINNDGHQMGEIHMEITNRKVESAESVATPAGNFDCFKISYDALVKAKIMGIGFPVHMHVIEWLAPALGRQVKSETYNKNNKLEGTMLLESIN